MKTIIKIRHGETIPENGKYLNTETVKEQCGERYEWRDTPGIMGAIPIFGTETLYRIKKYQDVTYHYYEVEE